MNNTIKQKCISCDRNDLSKDEIGINLKLIGKNTRNFYCLDCLADVLAVSVQDFEVTSPQLKTSKLYDDTLVIISCLLIAEFIYFNKHCHGQYDMSLNKWVGRPWGAGINATCALVGISGLMLTIVKYRIPIVNYIGEHSMVFFVVHYPIIFIYRFTCIAFGHNIRHHWYDCVILTILILIVCRLLVPYIERVPWLSGRIKKS